MIRVSDYLAGRVAELGVRHVFLVTGGGAMHLDDAFGRSGKIAYVCNHHEQASAIAAEAYARVSGNIGVCVLTSGPGGTNAVTGLLGQWLDSIPALYLSGQVRYETTVASTGIPLRQLGDQEADIVSVVRPLTKYARMVTDPLSIRYHFERAVHLALSGRPGPVWLDIPLDVQAAIVDETALPPYDPSEDPAPGDGTDIRAAVAETLARIRGAERPVLLAGNGIRLAGGAERFAALVDRLGIPVQTGFGGHDLIPSDHPRFFGRPSVTGDRSSNFIVQNSDFLLCLGTRLKVRQTGYLFDAFARGAFKVMVDADPAELAKPTLRLDLPVCCDAKRWIDEMLLQLGDDSIPPKTAWIDWCAERRRRYPSVRPEHAEGERYVNSYHFIDRLSDALSPDDIVVLANGAANTCTFQAIRLKAGQRLFTNSGCASMGYDLPAAIGAAFAGEGRRVVCIAGDGSIMMNLQEFQTIAHHRLPIKVFLLANDGYLSIRGTQDAFFEGFKVGESPASGVSFPDFIRLAELFGFGATRAGNHDELAQAIRVTLDSPGPSFCELSMDPNQPLLPKAASEKRPDGKMVSKPLEDMYPFLDRLEFEENMIIPPWK